MAVRMVCGALSMSNRRGKATMAMLGRQLRLVGVRRCRVRRRVRWVVCRVVGWCVVARRAR